MNTSILLSLCLQTHTSLKKNSQKKIFSKRDKSTNEGSGRKRRNLTDGMWKINITNGKTKWETDYF